MRKLLSITLAVCMVLSCVYTGTAFAATKSYSWELLRATGFETATTSTTDKTYNGQAQNSTNNTVFAGDNIVFANAANRVNQHYLVNAANKDLFVYTTPYSGDSYYEGAAIYMWENGGGTGATESNTLFGTVGKRIRVSFDVAAYNIAGGKAEKVVLDFDAADRTGYNCNQYNHKDYGSATIDVIPENTALTYERVSVEFDYSNAVTQKGFVIRFLADANNTDKTSKVGFRIDNVMIEAGTENASVTTKTDSIQGFDSMTLRDGETASYTGVFDKSSKDPAGYPTVGDVRCAFVNYNPNTSVSGMMWGNWKMTEFSRSYVAVTNNLLTSTANTGFIVADALPEFTAADIGKTYTLSTTIRPFNFKLDDDSTNNLTTTVPVKVGTITGYDYKQIGWDKVAARYGTITGYSNIETTNLTAYEKGSWDTPNATGAVYTVEYSFTVTPETLGVKGFFVELDTLSLVKTNAETSEKYTDLVDNVLRYSVGRIEVYETAATTTSYKCDIKAVDNGYMLYDPSSLYTGKDAVIAEYSNDVFQKLVKVTPNKTIYKGATAGNSLKGFIWNDLNETLVPLTEASDVLNIPVAVREFETYKTINFAKSTYTGGGANGGLNENGVKIGYTLSSNQFPFESGATTTLLMQVAAGGNTGIHIANQLPAFTSEDIGKMCKISIKVLPYDANVKGTVLKGYLGTSNVANTFAYPTDYTEGDITVMETWANNEYSVLEHEFIVTEAMLNNRSVVMWFTNSTTAAPLTFMVDDMVVMMEK